MIYDNKINNKIYVDLWRSSRKIKQADAKMIAGKVLEPYSGGDKQRGRWIRNDRERLIERENESASAAR